jgi:hypothetical protein
VLGARGYDAGDEDGEERGLRREEGAGCWLHFDGAEELVNECLDDWVVSAASEVERLVRGSFR